MDRAEWERACAGRYLEVLEVTVEEAEGLARDAAETERVMHGWEVEKWQGPVAAANEGIGGMGVEHEG